MNEQFKALLNLLDTIPGYNSSSCYSQIDRVLGKYISILNYVNGYNDRYKSATTIYYNNISDIRDNLQSALHTNNFDKKIAAYTKASEELKNDIKALAFLIEPKEEPITAYA